MMLARLLRFPRFPRLTSALRCSAEGQPQPSTVQLHAMHVCAAACGVSFLAFVALVATVLVVDASGRQDARTSLEAWRRHHAECLKTPEEVYHRDRARAVRGVVRDARGIPAAGALVRSVTLPSLLRLFESGPPSPESWPALVETETRVDEQGHYEFPHFDVGARMLCASADDLSPDVQGPVVVQDGSGARVDFSLEPPRALRVVLDAADRQRRVHLLPCRWWPELPSRDLAAGEMAVRFDGLGGPFQNGLVLLSDPSGERAWRVTGAFDLDRSDEITLSTADDYVPSPSDLPEWAASSHRSAEPTAAARSFFGMLTPLALFWNIADAAPRARPSSAPAFGGALLGYGPGAFLPVLIEASDGRAWLRSTSDASEFELPGLAAGVYTARAMAPFGRICFARGAVVAASETTELASATAARIDLDEPLCREVMGVVRWENGQLAEDAEVFLQDAVNFRRFLRRVTTNRNGFYSVSSVPSGQYVAFALPAKDERAMKSFVYPRVPEMPRETRLDFTLSPHRVVGQVRAGRREALVRLVRDDADVGKKIVWSVVLGDDGKFEISNVPHGRYVAHLVGEKTQVSAVSLPFLVERELTTTVRWSE